MAKKKSNRYRLPYARQTFARVFEEGVDRTVAFVDVETTGLSAKTDRITQFAGIKFRFNSETKEFTELETINTLIYIGFPLDPIISKKTHITDEMLAAAPKESEVFGAIAEFLSGIDCFIGYNECFDYGFVSEMYRRQNLAFAPPERFDVMIMFRDIVTVYKSFPCHQEGAARYFKIPVGKDSLHNALNDIRLTYTLFDRMFADYSAVSVTESQKGLPVPFIIAKWFWHSERTVRQNRIYFLTSFRVPGENQNKTLKIFYEIDDRSFGVDTAQKETTIYDLDMEKFVERVLAYMGVDRVEDLSHLQNVA